MKRIFKIIAIILIGALVILPVKTMAKAPDTSTMQKLLQYI